MNILTLIMLAVAKMQAALGDGKVTLDEAADLAWAEFDAAGIAGNKLAEIDPETVAAIRKFVNFVMKTLNKGGVYTVANAGEVVKRGLKKFKIGGLVLLRK